MDDRKRLAELRREGRMRWLAGERAWVARPHDVVDALAHDGFQEYKHEVARTRHRSAGGVWQGLNTDTGSVASAIWVRHPADEHAIVYDEHAIVYIDIDGRPLTDGAS